MQTVNRHIMAYIPDEAIEAAHTLAPSAWRLYCLLCRRRDHRARLARLSVHRACELMKISRPQFFAAQKWLLENSWISKLDTGEFILQKGCFTPVDIFLPKRSENSDSEKSDSLKIQTEKSENSDSTSPKIQTPQSEKPDSPLKEYPAYSSSLKRNQHTHHSTDADAARVPINNFPKNQNRSQFSLEECLRYAEHCVAKGDAIKNPKGLASHLYQTGAQDAFILAALYPEKNEEKLIEQHGPKRKFTDEPCTVCFGSRSEIVHGKGARPCTHCVDERGKRTGKEPEEARSNGDR
jgi:hypothetical protein